MQRLAVGGCLAIGGTRQAKPILSSVTSADYGPVWLLSFEVTSADTGDMMDRTGVTEN